jgi:hypothetical protein
MQRWPLSGSLDRKEAAQVGTVAKSKRKIQLWKRVGILLIACNFSGKWETGISVGVGVVEGPKREDMGIVPSRVRCSFIGDMPGPPGQH